MAQIPLFPLPLVLFPSGKLPLKIFEPRYVDMVGRCMREETGFGIVMIRRGQQVLQASLPSICSVGTYVRIVDFDRRDDGLLSVVVEGDVKVRIRGNSSRDDGLMLGNAEFLPLDHDVAVPAALEHLVSLLERFAQHDMVQQLALEIDFGSAVQVGARLTELLPCRDPVKQFLLELSDPIERLEQIDQIVRQMQEA